MGHRINRQYDIAWILPSPGHHAIATSFFDETYDRYSSTFPNITYSTGRVGQYNVVTVSNDVTAAPEGTGDVVQNLLQEFPSVRAGFLVSPNAIASQAGHARVGDVVVGTRPNLESGVVYFDAGETKKQNRLFIESQPKRIPKAITMAVEGLLGQQQRDDWLRSLDEGYPRHRRKAFRGVIGSSTEVLDDLALVDRIGAENGILCFETTAANVKSRSLVVVAGIASYSGSKQHSVSSDEICKLIISYIAYLVRLIDPAKLDLEPPLANYFEYEQFDLDRPGFRLLRLEAGSGPVRCHVFQAYLDDRESIIPYEALSYCWGNSTTLRHTVMVNGKVLFITANLFDALRELRYKEKDRILWVDAVCIDQSNITERGHQVGWMGKVYRHADEVLFWLGHVEYHLKDLILLFNRFKEEVPPEAWNKWPLDDTKWSDTWRLIQHHHFEGREAIKADQKSLLKALLCNEWFSRVWVLQEVANARKASLGCSKGWVDAKVFAIAPKLLGVKPNTQCQAIIDIMPGPSRRSSWWAQKSNVCTLLWKFRGSQASDPRDRLFALLGLASDMTPGAGKISADYTKTEEAVMKDIAAYLFDDNIHPSVLGITNLADLQIKIPNLSAIALDKMVLSGSCLNDVQRFVQKQNQTVWLSATAVNYTWCKRSDLMSYFENDSAFEQIVLGSIPDTTIPENTSTLRSFLDRHNGMIKATRDTIDALRRSGTNVVELVLRDNRDDIEITEALVEEAVQSGHDTLRLLLDRRGNEVRITKNIIEFSRQLGIDFFQTVLEHPRNDIKITTALAAEAAQDLHNTFQLLLDRRSDKFKTTETLVEREAEITESLVEREVEDMHVLPSPPVDVFSAKYGIAYKAEWRVSGSIQLLLDRCGNEVNVTGLLVETVADRLESHAIRLLLERRSNESIATESLIEKASQGGYEILRFPIDSRGNEVWTTRPIANVAIQSKHDILRLLLGRCGSEVKITHLLAETKARSRPNAIRLLLDIPSKEVRIAKSLIEKASWGGYATLQFLLEWRRNFIQANKPFSEYVNNIVLV